MAAWRAAGLITLLVAAAGALLTTFAAGRFRWGEPEYPKAQGEALLRNFQPGAGRYREDVSAAIVREPQNTWSNLAFVFAGVLIATHDRRIFARFLGAALIALGAASGLYHASLSPHWRTVDVMMMGWVSFGLICVGASTVINGRRKSIEERNRRAHFLVGIFGAATAMLVGLFRNDVRIAGVKVFDSTYTTIAGIAGVAGLLGLGLTLGVRTKPAFRWPAARVATLIGIIGAAVVAQLGDHPGHWLFRPGAFVQAHAIWHVLMGASAVCAYDLFVVIEGGKTLWRPNPLRETSPPARP